MSKYLIEGGRRLEGEIAVQGSKNATLPIMAACVLNSAENILHNVPDILDVQIMAEILTSIGCTVRREGSDLYINSEGINSNVVCERLVSQMRSSIVLLGALASRLDNVQFSYPGGSDIGYRPIDIHLKGLCDLGAQITKERGYIFVTSDNLHGKNIVLDYPSVGATESLILASIFSNGYTNISNAAKEPEIIDLQNFLLGMGAKVGGAGTNNIYIDGVQKLHGCEYTIMPDRIALGTYLCAVHITGGKVMLKNLESEDNLTILDTIKAPHYKLLESGLKIRNLPGRAMVESTGIVQPISSIVTQPYPGFPTDLQNPFLSMLSVAKGSSFVKETIFDSRFKFISQIARMGANIRAEGSLAVVTGVGKLSGAKVYAEDLRGGAALVLAALAAEGKSEVVDTRHIDRGYEKMAELLADVGACIKRVDY
ncbi:MAG: UDP-N-acetylglucosamine 1-carboxyvinyltransferase [Eubacteriaceae bacterium]|nr:UDP-N-acetylglucosamine 1-carboxyvinyltransferase [Eubacteriaceae bacterium]